MTHSNSFRVSSAEFMEIMFDLIQKKTGKRPNNYKLESTRYVQGTGAIIDGGIVFWVDEEVVLTPPVEIKSAGERRIEVEHS
jgi:hypothetical protein